MYCSRCGHELGQGDRFCGRCGAAAGARERGAGRRHRRAGVILGLAVVLGLLAAGAVALGPRELAQRWTALTGPTEPVARTSAAPSAPVERDPSSPVVTSPTPAETTSEAELPAPTDPGSHAPEGDFSSVYSEVRSGVVKVRASTCDGTGVGSGFLVDPQTVVTAEHVVTQAASVVVNRGAQTIEASVIGVHEGHDLAVLELAEPVLGHEFDLSLATSEPGEAVAVIGHPLGDPLTITQGVVSRVSRGIWPDVQIDAAVNPGSSGGPVIEADGSVVGIVLAKRTDADSVGLALRTDVAAPLIQSPYSLASPEPAFCDRPVGPGLDEVPDVPAVDGLHRAIATTLAKYFVGINTADYALAYDQFSPRLHSSSTLDGFAEGVSTSYDFDFKVRDVRPTADGARVWLEFVSMQAPRMGPDQEGCTEWSLDYHLQWFHGRLLIHRVQGHAGSAGHVPCT